MTAKSVFLFLLSLPSGAGSQRPAAVKGRAAFLARRERTLGSQDRCERIAREGTRSQVRLISMQWREQ
jgi:hypothetical protein